MLLFCCLLELPYDSNLRRVIVSQRVYIPSSDKRHILSATMILSSFIKRVVFTTFSDVINLYTVPDIVSLTASLSESRTDRTQRTS